MLDPSFARRLGDNPRAKRVVGNADNRIVLHHGHMLVGCGMVNGLDAVHLQHQPHESGIEDGTQHQHNAVRLPPVRPRPQVLLDLEQRRLGNIQQHKALWLQGKDLA